MFSSIVFHLVLLRIIVSSGEERGLCVFICWFGGMEQSERCDFPYLFSFHASSWLMCFFIFFCLCIGEREEFYKSLFVDCQKTSASAVFLLLLRL